MHSYLSFHGEVSIDVNNLTSETLQLLLLQMRPQRTWPSGIFKWEGLCSHWRVWFAAMIWRFPVEDAECVPSFYVQ